MSTRPLGALPSKVGGTPVWAGLLPAQATSDPRMTAARMPLRGPPRVAVIVRCLVMAGCSPFWETGWRLVACAPARLVSPFTPIPLRCRECAGAGRLVGREHPLPVVLHADDRPAARLRFRHQRLGE